MSTTKQKLIEILQNGGNESDVILVMLERLNDMETEMQEIKETHEEMMEKMEYEPPEETKVEKVAMKLAAKLATLEKGDKGEIGEKGDKGEQGEKGLDGKDGLNGKDGKDGRNGVDGTNGIDGKDGENGKDGSPDTPDQVRDKLETLKGEERLDKSAIKGLDDEFKKLDTRISSIPRGGGSGGRQSMFISEEPTGTVNGVNDTFYLSTTPKESSVMLFVQGQNQRPKSTYEYTIAGKKIVFNATDIPVTGSKLWVNYVKF